MKNRSIKPKNKHLSSKKNFDYIIVQLKLITILLVKETALKDFKNKFVFGKTQKTVIFLNRVFLIVRYNNRKFSAEKYKIV